MFVQRQLFEFTDKHKIQEKYLA